MNDWCSPPVECVCDRYSMPWGAMLWVVDIIASSVWLCFVSWRTRISFLFTLQFPCVLQVSCVFCFVLLRFNYGSLLETAWRIDRNANKCLWDEGRTIFGLKTTSVIWMSSAEPWWKEVGALWSWWLGGGGGGSQNCLSRRHQESNKRCVEEVKKKTKNKHMSKQIRHISGQRWTEKKEDKHSKSQRGRWNEREDGLIQW